MNISRICLLLVLPFLSCDAQKLIQTRMSDAAFFNKINLGHPGLKNVQEQVKKGNYYKAKCDYVDFLRNRSYPQEHFSSKIPTNYPSKERKSKGSDSELVLENTFTHENYTYQFPKKIDWHFNPTDKKQNRRYKEAYKQEWTVVFNRMKSVRLLANAFEDTGNPIYVKKLNEILRDWIRQCPPNPPNKKDRWRSSWRSLEAGIRVGVEWPLAFLKTIRSPELRDETIIAWIKSWMEHGEYLEFYQGKLNWLTTESKGLFTIGALFPEFKKSESFRNLALKRMRQQLEQDFYEDGAHVELSPEYHRISLEAIAEVYLLAKLYNYPISKDLLNPLEQGFDYLIKLSLPNHQLPRVNDSGPDTELLRVINKYALPLFPNRLDYQWFASNRTKGKAPNYTSVQLPWAGQTVMRDGWSPNSNYLLFEHGPYGEGSHQHEDKLGVHIAAYGDLFVFEAGRENYGDSPMRRYCLSSQAHSVVTVDDRSQNREAVKPKLNRTQTTDSNTWYSDSNYDYTSATYGDFYLERYGKKEERTRNKGVWKRHVFYIKPDIFVLVDIFYPKDENRHTYRSYFHLNAEKVVLNPKNHQLLIAEEGRPSFTIIPLQVPELKSSVIKGQKGEEILGWELFESREDRAIPTMLYRQKRVGKAVFAYVFRGSAPGKEIPETYIRQLSKSESELVLEVENQSDKYEIIFNMDDEKEMVQWKAQHYSGNVIIKKLGKRGVILE